MQAKHFTRETIKNIGMREGIEAPNFRPGDTIRVTSRVIEGEKERLQDFEGIVLGIKGSGISLTFRMRKISDGVAVERIFPLHTPTITSIVVVKSGLVRRAKLYYMRSRYGREADIKQKRESKKTAGAVA